MRPLRRRINIASRRQPTIGIAGTLIRLDLGVRYHDDRSVYVQNDQGGSDTNVAM